MCSTFKFTFGKIIHYQKRAVNIYSTIQRNGKYYKFNMSKNRISRR